MKTCLITTMGVSIYSWMKREWPELLDMEPSEIADILKSSGKGERASAEINSTNSIISKKILNESKELFLLTSDTEQGRFSSEVVKYYYEEIFETVEVITINGLNTDDSRVFRDEGLRQLVKATSRIIHMKKNKDEDCIINATGGYKAQISFVALLGQVLKIPVYYQFENFTEIIKLPSLPISLDMNLWINNFELFNKLTECGSLPAREMDESLLKLEEFQDLFDYSKGQYRLSSVGILMHEVLTQQFKTKGKHLLPKSISKETQPLSEKIINFPKYIPLALTTMLETIIGFNYVQKIKFNRIEKDFSVGTSFKREKGKIGQIIGTYSDGRDTWYFTVHTISAKTIEDKAISVDLNLRFTNSYETLKQDPVRFLLIRHGQHTGEKENRVEGLADFPLTDRGRKQASLLAQRLKDKYKVDVLYSSSLIRARETTKIIAEKLNLTPIILEEINAMNYGERTGLKKFEASIVFPKPTDDYLPHNKSWGRESEFEFAKRVLETFYEIYHTHSGETVAIVTHGRAISTIMREVLRLPITQDFRISAEDTSIHSFEMSPNRITVEYLNNSGHLSKLVEGE